ncbi:potassium-transporting ATPase, C subunit [Pseudarthrobacter chlorophenolicus A6]|uniref:Potassium-transporting ATPase KdpC subunit n=1 Tax=Pseudarthrobacter chlorophenolicus (strain ATCC 700700 / DSM 12829 / CIP 107037 / JCM 12360 / KCTC 9906 / NCIMB 13794 / A6) TaxID=452863 RepID=B8H6W9_PSECP|nr:K(+)-transporting ATPase subunit C [Pseudarthrobacter chlorophenolicus]ACL39690.1 potassium-transporting ATPase, C subunit [Pseudarthrobacter chlorophenolicus A6]SDQ95282.1 K+-transporting ATPase ATPase C chain [Pseudarthrobacter chlorophenolicus]
MTAYLRQLGTSIRFLAIATLLLGLIYPLAIFGAGQAVMPAQANGSIGELDGRPAASTLLAQAVPAGEDRFFHPRPSAVRWDPSSSGASNLGPSDPARSAAAEEERAAVAVREGVPAASVPADAVTASASGLDPDISVAYAQLQAPRVARAAGLSMEEVGQLITDATTSPVLGLLGQPAVNSTRLNLAVAGRVK